MIKFFFTIFIPCTAMIVNCSPKYIGIKSLAKDPQALRIMSFNIRRDGAEPKLEYTWNKRKNVLIELIRDFDPDIISLQEAKNNQIKDIIQAFNQKYDWIGEGRKDKKWLIFSEPGEHAPILYKKNICKVANSGTFWLNKDQKKGKPGWGATLNRICTWGKFTLKNQPQPLFVFNTHLDNSSQEARTQGLQLILNFIDAKTRGADPLILTGDFNEDRVASKYSTIIKNRIFDTDHLADLNNAAFGVSGSFGWGKPRPGIIDYIFINNKNYFDVLHSMRVSRTDERPVSDHSALVVDVVIKK